MDNKHECRTYLRICIDGQNRNAARELIYRATHDFLEEDGGFCVCDNREYDVDVNVMLQKTLAPFLGKEELLNRIKTELGGVVYLEIVPYISAESPFPHQILSLERWVVEFLYLSQAEMDLDYYVL